jgi:hypothetical protein
MKMSCENCGSEARGARNCESCVEVFYADALAREAALVAFYAAEDAAWQRELAGRDQDEREAYEILDAQATAMDNALAAELDRQAEARQPIPAYWPLCAIDGEW